MGWISWLCPGMNLKRWLLLFTVGVLCCALGLALFFNYQFMGYVEELMFRMAYLTTGKYSNTVSMLGGFLLYHTPATKNKNKRRPVTRAPEMEAD